MRIDPGRLPHWDRVAFAARCGRRVQPLFAPAWPDAAEHRVQALERALMLAERSAADRRPAADLKAARLNAIMVAGRALFGHHHPGTVDDGEVGPPDADSALVASFTAKVAEKAAQAAMMPPNKSAGLVAEALGFAVDAIHAAERPGLLEVLEADFEKLVATVGESRRSPWWRFW